MWEASQKEMLENNKGVYGMRAKFPAVLALCLLMQPLWGAVPASAQGKEAQITVTGEGRVEVAPDMAVVSLGVTTEAKTASEAMTGNSGQLAKVLENLKAAGIAERDLQTSGLSLSPNWNHSANNGPTIQGYIASNQLTVRVRDLASLGTVLDAAIKDGVNTLNGVTFGVENQAPLMDEARKRAVADARHKADLYSLAAGVTLGAVISIAEGGGGGGPAPMFRMAEAMAAAPVPVAEGEISIAASVTVVWELRP